MRQPTQWQDHAARFGANLKQLREAQGLSITQAAEVAGITKSYWHQLETQGGVPTLYVALSIAAALNVGVYKLAGVNVVGDAPAVPGVAQEVHQLRRKLARIRNICDGAEE